MTVKTLDDFRREVDPMFVDKSPVPIFNKKLPVGTKSVIITSAQNATPVHVGFWRALMTACSTYGSEMVVIPIRYKNPTSRWTGSQENTEHWVEEVRPYLSSTRTKLNKNCLLLADIKIQPTASDPLTGFEAISQDMSAIVGHPKVQTRTIATPQNKLPKVLMTTGACTVANYSDTRAGRVGEFHHSLSAVIVELQGGLFFARRLHYDIKSQSITDTVRRKQFFSNGKIKTSSRAAALVCGDLHERFACPKAVNATWGPGGMVEVGEPENVILHDSVDGYSVNHHHGKNPFNRIAKLNSGFSARYELESFRDFIKSHTRKGVQNVIVTSNHDDFFSRYIVSQDWRDDPLNAEWYLETALHMVQNTITDEKGTSYPDAFKYWMNKYNLPQTKLLSGGESFVVRGVELGMHGDKGPNGSRGSAKNLRRIGVKSIIGHCLTEGHDVLTREGWKPIATSTPSELLSYDPTTGGNVWLPVLEKQEFDYRGPVVRIRHRGAFDQEVTPNHKLMMSDGALLPVCEAVLTRSPSDLPVRALPEIQSSLVVDETTIRRVVAVCADGNFYKQSLTFHLKKQRKIDRLLSLFGGSVGSQRAGHNGAVKMLIRMDSEAYGDVTRWVVPHTDKKTLPKEWINLSPACREILIDELHYWDGTFKTDGNDSQYSTFKESESDLVSSLLTLSGIRHTCYKRIDSRGWILSWCDHDSNIPVSRAGYGRGFDKKVKDSWGHSVRNIDGKVYCFTVDKTHCFWVRSHATGLVSLTGNSHTPCEDEGATQVGTMSRLKLEYNSNAPSGWLNANCFLNQDGKRQMVFIIDGQWHN